VSIIEPLLPGADGRRIGRPRSDDRRVLNAIFFVELLVGLPPSSDVVADRGYDYTCVLEAITDAGSHLDIPTAKQNRRHRNGDPALYQRRNLAERCFHRLEHWHRVATSFDKLARNHLSTVAIAAVRRWTWLASRT
jgi:transposase